MNDTEHIEYEKHSYIIPIIIKKQFEKNEFIEKDFKDNLKLLGYYFYHIFIEDSKITPTEAKIIFKNKFPNIDIEDKYINIYINTKYKESTVINQEKIKNTDRIFSLRDENNDIISHVIDFKNIKDITEKFILIGNKNMLSQLSNNNIDQFFMDCTYKVVPPNIYKFKLMLVCGIDLNKNKTVLYALILLGKENKDTFNNIFGYFHLNIHSNQKDL